MKHPNNMACAPTLGRGVQSSLFSLCVFFPSVLKLTQLTYTLHSVYPFITCRCHLRMNTALRAIGCIPLNPVPGTQLPPDISSLSWCSSRHTCSWWKYLWIHTLRCERGYFSASYFIEVPTTTMPALR